MSEPRSPIYVDLDNTLIKTDLLQESVVALLKINVLYFFLLPIWLMKGRAYLKDQIATRVELQYDLLPYNEDLLSYLRQEKSKGRRLILATASHRKLAFAINESLELFDDVIATDIGINLKSTTKLNRILELQGEDTFTYVGDSTADHPIFREAGSVVLVNPGRKTQAFVRKLGKQCQVFNTKKLDAITFLKSIRLYQWVKNVLIFVPLFAAHQWHSEEKITAAVLAFVAFGLCASSLYLMNDVFDLDSDRAHAKKRYRPLASGVMPISTGFFTSLIMISLGVVIAYMQSIEFTLVLLVYIALTSAYTLVLKQVVLVDAIILASLFTIRVVSGAVAVDVGLSFWLLAFSIFLFFSLALIKRCSELYDLQARQKTASEGRDYNVSDIGLLQTMGVGSGILSILVVALYINDPEIKTIYSHYVYLWLICPLLLYWISRMWLKTSRGEMHSDPIVFAMKDKVSLLILSLVLLSSIAAI